jgi:hypothetical protein
LTNEYLPFSDEVRVLGDGLALVGVERALAALVPGVLDALGDVVAQQRVAERGDALERLARLPSGM